MAKCQNCGYEAPENNKYCPMCGYAIHTESSNPEVSASAAEAGEEKQQKYYKVVNGLYEYPKAPVGKRFGAFIVDSIILLILSAPSIILFMIGVFMNFDPETFDPDTFDPDAFENGGVSIVGGMMSFWGSLLLILPAIYYFIKDGMKNGQSFGKRIAGIMVVDTQKNTPCKMGKSAFRNLISSLIVAIPFVNFITFWIEPIMVLARNDGRKAADLVASTQVIDTVHFRQ